MPPGAATPAQTPSPDTTAGPDLSTSHHETRESVRALSKAEEKDRELALYTAENLARVTFR